MPNRALRRRIEEHDAELDRLAEQMAARMEAAAEEVAEAAAAGGVAAVERAAAAEAENAALRQELLELKAARGEGSSSASAVKRGRDDQEADSAQQANGRRTSSRRS